MWGIFDPSDPEHHTPAVWEKCFRKLKDEGTMRWDSMDEPNLTL
jgi:hypothetical protein